MNGLCGVTMVRSTIDNRSEEGPMTKVTTVGIDLAKSVFQVHGGEARACSCGRRAESQSVASEASGGAANVQHADTDREIAPLLHDWQYPQEGKTSG